MMHKKFKRKINMEIEHFEQDNRLKIRNQTFFDEISLNQYVKWGALSKIIFLDCHFDELDLLGKVINFCDFKNCRVTNLSFRKCQFADCRFENCQIKNSDFTRAEFDDCSFRNCEFIKSDLAASTFWDCQLIKIKFKNSRLDRIVARNIKCWKSNEPIEIKMSSNFKEILDNLEFID